MTYDDLQIAFVDPKDYFGSDGKTFKFFDELTEEQLIPIKNILLENIDNRFKIKHVTFKDKVESLHTIWEKIKEELKEENIKQFKNGLVE